MKRLSMATIGLAVLLAGCSEAMPMRQSVESIERLEAPAYADAPENKFGFVEAMEEPGLFNMMAADEAPGQGVMDMAAEVPGEPGPPATASVSPATTGQIAYSYGYGFRIGADDIVALQERHIALCEKMAPACRIIRTSQAKSDSYDAYGEVRMEVAADKAGSLQSALVAPAEELGGALVSSVREGEDLSEQIIDTEARLKSRLVLRDKLTEILRGTRGSVAELVAAEAEVAKVNEEIDAVRARLESYRGRIRYSDVKIEYEPAFGETQVGFVRPVATALGAVGTTLGMSLAAIIYTLTALFPVIGLVAALRWVLHRFGWRLRFWMRDLRKAPEADAAEAA
jgi:hypothetical protein